MLPVDDHALFRAGLRTLIQRHRHAEVGEVVECDTGEQALRAIAKAALDIAMLDISLRGGNGIALARRISAPHQRAAWRARALHRAVDAAQPRIRAPRLRGRCQRLCRCKSTT